MYKFMHSLWGDMLTQQVEVGGCVGIVEFLWCTCTIKVYSRSPEPRKLCGVRVAINYTPLSMAYYAHET